MAGGLALALYALALCQNPVAAPQVASRATDSLDDWLASETAVSLKGILAQIGADSAYTKSATPAIVIASPSTSSPGCALLHLDPWFGSMIQLLVNLFHSGKLDLQTVIEEYVNSQAYLQTVSSPSSGFSSGEQVEPKFHVEMSAFTGGWGRPQRDGPALLTTALSASASGFLGDNGYDTYAVDNIRPIVQNDLSYIDKYRPQSGYDLWEEVNGMPFFTVVTHHRALVEGSAFASRVGASCSWCDSQAAKFSATCRPSGPGTVLASCVRQPQCVHWFFALRLFFPQGVAISAGRYPEYSYYNNNPCFLTTLAAAEQLYDAIYQWNKVGSITTTSISLFLFKDIYGSAAIGTYSSSSTTFTSITNAVKGYAGSYMSVAQSHAISNRFLAEQFNKSTSIQLFAHDLNWSYAALLTANAIVPPS
ncbi:hypothetical protein PENFLA_c051G07899 [Penicillium flavigenum]|uniref:glucan 1,4-alpha-glucosidase n=1 Tax=Penicillium flavigenum TaxID=254877 RepID=A0A1V6SI85_9EURO|nr:hypothetical protein PENFLA_c051G07899 [Penicillium flavigenum]